MRTMSKYHDTTDIVDSIKKLDHEEMQLQLLELIMLSPESKKTRPLEDVIPFLYKKFSNEFASAAYRHVIVKILSDIYCIPNQEIEERIAHYRNSITEHLENTEHQSPTKDINTTNVIQDSHSKPCEIYDPKTSESKVQKISLDKKVGQIKAESDIKPKHITGNQVKPRRRTRIKAELSDSTIVSSTEPSLKRKNVSKKQGRLETLQSVSHLAVLFNVSTKGDSITAQHVCSPHLWLGCQQGISYELFLSLDKLVDRGEFLSAFGLLIEKQPNNSNASLTTILKRVPSTLPHEQPKDDIDMRAGLVSLLSPSECQLHGITIHMPDKQKTCGQLSTSTSVANLDPSQSKKEAAVHLLTQLLLSANGISLSMPADVFKDPPTSPPKFTLMKEILEFSLYYQGAHFFEKAISNSKQRFDNAMNWAYILKYAEDPPISAEMQSLLNSLTPYIKLPVQNANRSDSSSYIHINLPLRHWINDQQLGPSRPLSNLQRAIIAKLKLPNPLPAAHNLDSDLRLLYFSKQVISQAMLNLYYNSSSTMTVSKQPCDHLTKYLLPMGIPPVRLVLLDEPLHGPLFDPYERYSLIPVHHPELQFLVAPPRYLDQPAFLQNLCACAPPLGPTRLAPRLTLKVEQRTGSTNLTLDEAIGPRTCIMDIIGCYLPIEEAHRILCHIIDEGFRSSYSYAAVWNEVVRYCSHCIYLEELRVVIDMNRCSSLSVYIQFTEFNSNQAPANCEIGLCYSLDYVICRLYSTISIPPGTSILLPPKYCWLKKKVPIEITGCTADDMRKELLSEYINGCERFLPEPLDSILAVPAYDPFSGGYSLLSYPGPYLSLIKEAIAVMMSVSYRHASKFVPTDYLSLLEGCRTGFRNPGPGYTDMLSKGIHARVTLQRNVEFAQRMVLSLLVETENLNLFLAMDRENLLDKQSIDTDTLIPVIAQRFKDCYLYGQRCRHAANGTLPTVGSSSAVLLKQAMDNRANTVKRIGTEYNHFLLLYRLAFIVQAMEDLFSHPIISNELFVQTDLQIPVFGYIELGLETPQEQSQDSNDVKTTCSVINEVLKPEQLAVQEPIQMKKEPASNISVAPARNNIKLEEPTEQESKSTSLHTICDKDTSEWNSSYIQELYAASSTPYIDLNSIRLVSTLDYLMGEPLPEQSLASILTEDEMRRGLSNALGYGY